MSLCLISSENLSWLVQNFGILFHTPTCRRLHFVRTSTDCTMLYSLPNMGSRCFGAHYQTAPLAGASTGSPIGSPKSLQRRANSAHPEHGQRLAGYVGLTDNCGDERSDQVFHKCCDN